MSDIGGTSAAQLAAFRDRAALVRTYFGSDGRVLPHPLFRLAERLTATSNGCWITGKATTPNGYVLASVGSGNLRGAHRFVFEAVRGPIPPGMVIDHLCRNRQCVNPAHLEAVSQQENVRRGESGQTTRLRQLAKQMCPYGHPYSGENLIVQRGGGRACRACHSRRNKEYKARLRGLILCEAA